MLRLVSATLTVLTLIGFADLASAQESKPAQATRKLLKQKLTIEAKEVGTKAFLDDVIRELDKEFKYIIDNASGVSNNTKISYKGKDVTVEQVLNEISDKLDCGWIVSSNPGNNKYDGKVILRKSSKGKERGYEAGKEPKKGAALALPAATVDVARNESQIEAADTRGDLRVRRE